MPHPRFGNHAFDKSGPVAPSRLKTIDFQLGADLLNRGRSPLPPDMLAPWMQDSDTGSNENPIKGDGVVTVLR